MLRLNKHRINEGVGRSRIHKRFLDMMDAGFGTCTWKAGWHQPSDQADS